MALWSADLARSWMPCLPATDASGSFGFGLSVASCHPDVSKKVARHARDFDHHVRLALDSGDPREVPRSGRSLRLSLRRRDFETILSTKAKISDHSGGLEATGVVLGMRRLARRRGSHRHRGAFLVDAQAVLRGLQQERSSAPTLRHPIRQAGAISPACGWRWRFAHFPSEPNPVDDPSRGGQAEASC